MTSTQTGRSSFGHRYQTRVPFHKRIAMIGFTLNELMTGDHHFTGQGTDTASHPLLFHITWGNQNLFRFLNPFSGQFLFNQAKGFITVGGLANKADCTGSLHLLYFTRRKIRYELFFTGDDNRSYQYIGEKVNLWPWNLHKTHFTCHGTIQDVASGTTVSKSVIYFPYREMPAFLGSFRLFCSRRFPL